MARQICFLAAMLAAPSLSTAQEPVGATRFVTPASLQAPQLTSAQISDLVAPVALYPDALLSQVLVASTYPLEVVQAQQWLRRNESLRGQALMDEARQQPWDASVQGLVAFPDALATLNQDIQWTTALGNAFLAQESDVMAAVQRMRAQAQASGTLASSAQQTVSVVAQEGRTVIEIVPADPEVLYVPRYDPYYVWGAPAWSAYPVLSYGYGYGYGPGIDVGYWFGGWAWGWGWGWGPNWYGGSVYVNNAFFSHCGYHYGHHGGHDGGRNGEHYGRRNGGYDGGNAAGAIAGRETWRHDAGHRMGVPYSNSRLASRYDAASRASRLQMSSPGSWGRPGGVAGSLSGTRAIAPGSRGGVGDQAWRTGTRAVAPGTGGGGIDQGWRAGNRAAAPDRRGGGSDQAWRTGTRAVVPESRAGGADRGWSSSGDQWRRSERAPRSQDPSARYSASSPRSTVSSPRYSAPSSSYPAPSRSFSSSAPTRGFQSAPRSLSPSGAGRSFGDGRSQMSGAGSGTRGAAGGFGSGGASRPASGGSSSGGVSRGGGHRR